MSKRRRGAAWRPGCCRGAHIGRSYPSSSRLSIPASLLVLAAGYT